MSNTTAIAPLTKVSLRLTAIPAPPNPQRNPEGIDFEFICGLAIEGLTAFEKELHGSCPGDEIRMRIEAREMTGYFEHLLNPLVAAVKVTPPFDLTIEVLSVAPVSERELIHALAKKTESSGMGCGGDCGCGCG